MTSYLTLEQALLLCRRLDVQVRDIGLLDSALHRPRSSFAGVEPYEGVPAKAAALMHSLLRNHALVDGNKRLAWLATVVFLDLNGFESALTQDEATLLVLTTAADNTMAVADIEKGLATRRHGDVTE